MRLMIAKIGLGLALLLSAPATHAQDASVVLQPTTQWRVNYAENECQLLRTFGSGDQMVALRFARSASSKTFDFVLAAPAMPRFAHRLKVTLRLDPQGVETESDGFSSQITGREERFLRIFDADASLLPQFTAEQILTVRAQNTIFRLNLTNVRAAIAALQTCQDDLLTGWGFDLAAYHALRSAPNPVGNEANWVRTIDYPETHASGITTMRLVIGVNGRVTSCFVVVSSGSTRLDNAACEALMDRARYSPATSMLGIPTEISILKRVRWQRD